MTPSEFWASTPRSTSVFIDQTAKRKQEDEGVTINTWRLIRWVGWMLYSVNSKKRKSPKQLLKLPGDTPKPVKWPERDFKDFKRKSDKIVRKLMKDG